MYKVFIFIWRLKRNNIVEFSLTKTNSLNVPSSTLHFSGHSIHDSFSKALLGLCLERNAYLWSFWVSHLCMLQLFPGRPENAECKINNRTQCDHASFHVVLLQWERGTQMTTVGLLTLKIRFLKQSYFYLFKDLKSFRLATISRWNFLNLPFELHILKLFFLTFIS